MFSCEEVLAGLSDYLDNELAEALRKQVEEHMVHCQTCRAVYDSTRKTLRIVTESGSFELSEDVSSRVAANIREKIRARYTKPGDTPRS
jgi:predicted anti-sigma-YlaC factor YlaD